MWRLFIRIFVILFIISGTAVFLVMLIGSSRPAKVFASLFSNADGSACNVPCLLGIHIRQTRVTDVPGILASHPEARNLISFKTLPNTFAFGPKGKPESLTFTRMADGRVDYLELSYPLVTEETKDLGLTLGDIIQTFGVPDLMLRCPNQNGFVLIYFGTGVVAVVPHLLSDGARLTPTEAVAELFVVSSRDCLVEHYLFDVIPWAGFTSQDYYDRTPTVQKSTVELTMSGYPIPCIIRSPSGISSAREVSVR